MPAIASQAAIASDIGHGQLGLRSGLRTLNDLYGTSNAQKQNFVEIRLGKIYTGFSVVSGSVYKVAVSEIWDSRRLDVVAVRTEAETLTRVDGTPGAGQFSFDVDNQISGEYRLQVRLTDGTNPSGHTVMALFAFYFSDVGCYQPALEDDQLVDGDLEIWTSPTALTNWTVFSGSAVGASVNKDTAIVYRGSASARCQGTLTGGISSGGGTSGFLVDLTTVANAMYRISGYCRVNPAYSPNVVAALVCGDLVNSVNYARDGRSQLANGADVNRYMVLNNWNGSGDWQHFLYDFSCFSTSTRIALAAYNLANMTAYGEVWFDKIRLQRIRQFVYYEPRLGSLPTYSRGRNTIFFDSPQIGSGTLTLRNGDLTRSNDGYFQTLLGRYIASRGDVIHRIAGRYPNGGNEIPLEDMGVERSVMGRPEVADDAVSLPVNSPQIIYKEELPRRRMNSADAPAGEARDTARPRLLIFGGSFGCRPIRIAKSGTTGYGTYEGIDPKYVTNVAPTSSATSFAYSSEEAANKANLQEQASQTALTGTDATIMQMNTDIKLIRIKTGVNDTLDFDQGAGALVAIIPAGLYCVNAGSPTLTNAIQTALNAVGTGFTVSYSDTTHKYTITKSAGTLNLRLTSAAANAAKSAWRTIGYTATTDKTGALSYAADTVMFVDCDSDHIVRANIVGYKDDTSGTYTGSASATISRTMDIAYFLLNRVFGIPSARIDLGALANVRGLDSTVRCTIGKRSDADGNPETLQFGEILSRLENSSGIDCIFDGDRFTFVRRDNSTPANILDVYDRDILEFKAYPYEEEDLASTVVVKYEDDTNTGIQHSTQNESAQALVLLGGIGSLKTFVTYADSSGVNSRLDEFVANTSNRHRRFSLTLKGAAMGLRYMDKIRINRSKYLGRADDPSNQVLARVLNFPAKNPATWEVQILAAEVLGVTNGW
jgi:hypothetical protein